MKNYISYLFCLLIFEKKNIRKIIENLIYFHKNINIFYYVLFLFNRKKFNPVKIRAFKNYVKENSKKWHKNNHFQNEIIIENFINHPAYTLVNTVSAALLNKYYNYKLSAILRPGDIKAEILLRSFGVKKFYNIKQIGFFDRIKYVNKAINLINKNLTIKKFLKIKYNKIEVGISTYDTFIRYTKNPNLKLINNELIVMLAECLFHCDFFENLVHKNKQIKLSVQSETVFNPVNSFFQVCLKKNIQVFSRCGKNKISLRRYTKWSQRHNYRYNISQKLFDNFFKNNFLNVDKEFNKFYSKKIKDKKFGIDSRIEGLLKKNKRDIDKKQIIRRFKWKNKKKIGVFFLNHLIDRNFHNGPRVNFQDNYTWTKFILKYLPKMKKINWIIKPHPTEYFYNPKKNFDNEINILLNNFNHIKLYPSDFSSASLLKIADFAVTSHGTVGVEYPAFGIKSLFAENSFYSRLNFINMIKNKKKLVNKLINLDKSKRVSKKITLKCKSLLLIREKLLNNRCTYIPDHIISRKIDENLFWNEGLKKMKKFNYKHDLFYKMLGKQIKFNMRHTINFEKFKIDQIEFRDFD